MAKEWKKVEDNVFRFEKAGDEIEGVLQSRERGQAYGNEVYKIKDQDGKNWVVFSTTVLERKMLDVKERDEVKIVFTGTEPSKKHGQNDIKLFDVFVK